jgi:signal transduction histidine kinase/CheY-like chemotaxis protein/purine-cytosine permease-like protein
MQPEPVDFLKETGPPTQRIVLVRREYNTWVANESIEDYALRYTPRSFRKWSEIRVANTALGAVSFLALEAIGASIAVDFGFINALWAILLVSAFIFLTSIPICIYAARYSVDIDLLTRGSGFGYLGSTLSSFIYASFTFIFFSLEAVIMASALELGLSIPLWLGYLVCSVAVIPLVMYGITMISRIQSWTQPIWIVLLAFPYLFLWLQHPKELDGLLHASYGINDGHFNWLLIGSASTVVASMVAQVGEQVDFLRFMPEQQQGKYRWRWWAALMTAGPGWIILGGAKMLGGATLAFLAIRQGLPTNEAIKPLQMYLVGYAQVFQDPKLIIGFTCLFVIISQVKVTVSNAYAGSLAWSNFFSRLTHAHPGRLVWLVFNVLIGVALIKVGVFDVLEGILSFYACFAVAWIGALVADLVVNKPLGWSPPGIEFRRAYLFDINPVGFIALGLGTTLALISFLGVFGQAAQACTILIGFSVAFCSAPFIAWVTKGKFYIARKRDSFIKNKLVNCDICEKPYETPDMARCPAYGCNICSLCCSLDARCEDICKPPKAILAHQIVHWFRSLSNPILKTELNSQTLHLLLLFGLALLLGTILSFVVSQESQILFELAPDAPARWNLVYIKICFALVLLLLAIGACWLLLSSDSRHVAQDESKRQAKLLMEEIAAHEITDKELQQARLIAERSNLAKSQFLTNISHELRTPLNSILGYAQILERELGIPSKRRSALEVIRKSGDHVVSLIDGLLDIASIEAGRMRLVNSEFNFREFLNQLAEIFSLEATNKGIVFDYEPASSLPLAVRGDKKRVAQILINLLSNAIKYTSSGNVVFKIQYTNEIATFVIKDSGAGILPEDIERIFLPFERANPSGISVSGGVGLGLSISTMLSILMGGDITVKSKVSVGSTFTVRLFLRTGNKPQAVPELFVPRHIGGYQGPRRRILIVDDASVDRQMLCDVLVPLGFLATSVDSGVEALRIASDINPDLIILDIDMPGMTGWETARLLRANKISLAPILIVSAHPFGMDLHDDVDIRRKDFIFKPVKIDRLLERIASKLSLSWIEHHDISGTSDSSINKLIPEKALHELQILGKQGYLRGIIRKLDELDELDSGYQHLTVPLRHFAERFDLQGYQSELNKSYD